MAVCLVSFLPTYLNKLENWLRKLEFITNFHLEYVTLYNTWGSWLLQKIQKKVLLGYSNG